MVAITIVGVLVSGDNVYHLTPPSDHNHPTGWMAVQYGAEDRSHFVLMALPPRGDEDGVTQGTLRGAEIIARGIPLNLDQEWGSAVIEIDSTR